MQIRPITTRKKVDNRQGYSKIRLLMGIAGFVIGVYLTVKLIIIVYR